MLDIFFNVSLINAQKLLQSFVLKCRQSSYSIVSVNLIVEPHGWGRKRIGHVFDS